MDAIKTGEAKMGEATFVVDGVTYEGVVRLLPNGAMEALVTSVL